MTNIYGYARVSSKDQNEARQIIALSQFPVKKENIYIDKFSGKDFDRPKYSDDYYENSRLIHSKR